MVFPMITVHLAHPRSSCPLRARCTIGPIANSPTDPLPLPCALFCTVLFCAKGRSRRLHQARIPASYIHCDTLYIYIATHLFVNTGATGATGQGAHRAASEGVEGQGKGQGGHGGEGRCEVLSLRTIPVECVLCLDRATKDSLT